MRCFVRGMETVHETKSILRSFVYRPYLSLSVVCFVFAHRRAWLGWTIVGGESPSPLLLRFRLLTRHHASSSDRSLDGVFYCGIKLIGASWWAQPATRGCVGHGTGKACEPPLFRGQIAILAPNQCLCPPPPLALVVQPGRSVVSARSSVS